MRRCAQAVQALGAAIFGARSTSIPNDQAQMTVSFDAVRHLAIRFGLLVWKNLRNCLPPIVCLPVALLGCHDSVVLLCWLHWCQNSSSLPTRPRYRERLSKLRCWPKPFSFLKTVEVNVQGPLIRSPESLRPLTLCNCDCRHPHSGHVFGVS